jgi:hypothetical protein
MANGVTTALEEATDFVASRYGINAVKEFARWKRFVIFELQRIARMHTRKPRTRFDSLQYGNFLRVYFLLDKRHTVNA